METCRLCQLDGSIVFYEAHSPLVQTSRGGRMSTVVDACDPGICAEGLRNGASLEGALCVAFHPASSTSAPALGTEIDCE